MKSKTKPNAVEAFKKRVVRLIDSEIKAHMLSMKIIRTSCKSDSAAYALSIPFAVKIKAMERIKELIDKV